MSVRLWRARLVQWAGATCTRHGADSRYGGTCCNSAWDLDADRHRNNLMYFASEGYAISIVAGLVRSYLRPTCDHRASEKSLRLWHGCALNAPAWFTYLMHDHQRIAAQITEEGQLLEECPKTVEVREAFDAFAECRPPNFAKLSA